MTPKESIWFRLTTLPLAGMLILAGMIGIALAIPLVYAVERWGAWHGYGESARELSRPVARVDRRVWVAAALLNQSEWN